MLALRIDSLDPCFNLALEETLFNALEPGRPGWFLIWRNGPSIIVGRHQNTLEEINEDFVRAAGLSVVRRPTGGGAVYHDEGNINFSFLTVVDKNRPPSFADFLSPIVGALADLGVTARFSSRNDITVEGRKISGSAQRRSGSRMLHHGTMMVDLDAGILGKALTGNPDKYRSKGVASHKSRVANLREFLPPDWSRDTCMTRVIDAMARRCATGETSLPPPAEGRGRGSGRRQIPILGLELRQIARIHRTSPPPFSVGRSGMPVQRQKRRHHPLLPVRRFFHVGRYRRSGKTI